MSIDLDDVRKVRKLQGAPSAFDLFSIRGFYSSMRESNKSKNFSKNKNPLRSAGEGDYLLERTCCHYTRSRFTTLS